MPVKEMVQRLPRSVRYGLTREPTSYILSKLSRTQFRQEHNAKVEDTQRRSQALP